MDEREIRESVINTVEDYVKEVSSRVVLELLEDLTEEYKNKVLDELGSHKITV